MFNLPGDLTGCVKYTAGAGTSLDRTGRQPPAIAPHRRPPKKPGKIRRKWAGASPAKWPGIAPENRRGNGWAMQEPPPPLQNRRGKGVYACGIRSKPRLFTAPPIVRPRRCKSRMISMQNQQTAPPAQRADSQHRQHSTTRQPTPQRHSQHQPTPQADRPDDDRPGGGDDRSDDDRGDWPGGP